MSKIKIIVGPPCSGKSTYVAKSKGDDDVVIDYDKIAQALGSNESHAAPNSISFVASKARFAAIDAVLAGIAATAWIIHTSPSQEMIEQYEADNAEFYFMDTTLEACLERVSERPEGTAEVIQNWFENRPVLPNAILINSDENKMTKAYSTLKVKAINEDDGKRTITGIATTPRLDRDGDTMDMAGAEYALPFPFMWQHDHCQPVGEVVSATVTEDQIEVIIEVAVIEDEGDLKKRIDNAWHSLKSRLVKGLSIGFGVKDYEWINGGTGMHVKAWDWYELSAVTVGANPDAVITSAKSIKQAFIDAKTPAPRPVKTVTDTPVPKTTIASPVATDETQPLNHQSITLVDPNLGSIPLENGENL